MRKKFSKTFTNLDWEESFLDSSKDDAESLEVPLENNIFKKLLVISAIFLLLLFLRVFYMQIVQGKKYLSLSSGNTIRSVVLKAPRGVIFDSKGRQLVKNIPATDVVAIPVNLPQKKEDQGKIVKVLSEILKIPKLEIQEKIKDLDPASFHPVLIQNNISHDALIKMERIIKDLPGIEIQNSATREYWEDENFSAILGYLGKISAEEYREKKNKGYQVSDFVGKSGIEASYENELRGIDGSHDVVVDVQGKIQKTLGEKKYTAGYNLKLSIDANLQLKLNETLKQKAQEFNTKKGAAIALNPQNGEVLALASLPVFNNNIFNKPLAQENLSVLLNDPSQPLFNRAISGTYPPGSTIKPLIALGALEEGIINKDSTVLSTGGIKIGKWFFPDWKNGGHGITDLNKAIAESVNTYFYLIAGGKEGEGGLGVERINKYARLFGLGDKLGIDLPGEGKGFLPSKIWKEKEKGEIWYVGDTYHLAIGQGDITITPLQLATYISAIANGGSLFRPHIVKEILDVDGKIIKKVQPEIIRKDFVSKYNIELVKKAMRMAVISGSAKALSTLPVDVAGKTGTAQTGKRDTFHGWFVGFAPYENPQIVLAVLLEEAGGGDEVAVPVAYEVLRWYFNQP